MSKLKTPLLSFSAQGTLKNSLTLAHWKTINVAKTIPLHPDSRSLNQLYQRYRFTDALYYWQTLSLTQKKAYKEEANKTNNTLFGTFLKEYVKLPPDQVLWSRGDRRGDSMEPDFSKHAHNGSRYGPTLVPGKLDSALYYDGTDDYISFPHHADYTFSLSNFTLLFWVKPHTFLETNLLGKIYTQNVSPYPIQGWLAYYRADGTIWIDLYNQIDVLLRLVSTNPITLDTYYHLAFLVDRTNNTIQLYISGELVPSTVTSHGGFNSTTSISNTQPIYICRGYWFMAAPHTHATIDDLRIYNRLLSPEHIKAIYLQQEN